LGDGSEFSDEVKTSGVGNNPFFFRLFYVKLHYHLDQGKVDVVEELNELAVRTGTKDTMSHVKT
jgi:hypothetical protein